MIDTGGSSAIGLLNSGDLLEDDAWLAGALSRWGIPPPGALSEADRAALRELRALLRRLARAVVEHGTLPDAELAELNAVIRATPVRAELVTQRDGGYLLSLTPLADTWRELAVRELAGAFASMLRQSFPPRLKLCDNCGTAFWDGTRSRTRRWCDSRTCGNRVRVRRHRGQSGSSRRGS